jgi:hypothetical protein
MDPDTLLLALSLVSFFALVLVWLVQPNHVPAGEDLPVATAAAAWS